MLMLQGGLREGRGKVRKEDGGKDICSGDRLTLPPSTALNAVLCPVSHSTNTSRKMQDVLSAHEELTTCPGTHQRAGPLPEAEQDPPHTQPARPPGGPPSSG